MAFPTTGILDNFNRTAQGPPLTGWTTIYNGHKVSGNVCVGNTAGDANVSAWNTGSYGPSLEVYITITTASAIPTLYILDSTLDHGYSVVYNGSVVQIYRQDNFGTDEVQLGADISQSFSNGDALGLEYNAATDTITAYRKPSGGSWTSLGSRTESTYTDMSRFALFSWSTASLDDFGGGTLASGSVALTVADAAHAHTADNIALTQHNALAVAQATHAHTADNAVLSTATALTVAQATHAHTADGVALTQHNVLAVAQTTHGHTADNLALTQHYSLTVAQTTHGHTADGMTLAPHYTLAIDDAGHNSFADSPTLGVGLTVAQATHGHTADGVALTQHNVLAIADATHAHAADNLTLGVLGLLAVADATHGHTADGVALTQHNVLAIADATHAHAADGVTLTQHNVLTVAQATHAHTADGMTLSALALVVAATIHLHAADNLTLTQHNVLAVADATHAHTAAQANVGTPAGLVLSANVEIGIYASAVEVRRALTADVEL